MVFNAACQSMKGNNPEMAEAFMKSGAVCYTGFTESNRIGPWTNSQLGERLLSGFSVYSAYQSLPDIFYQETFELPENSGVMVNPKLILWPENELTSICITHPETLPAEISSNNEGTTIKLKGSIKTTDPGQVLVEGGGYGFQYSDSPDFSSYQVIYNEMLEVINHDKNTLTLSFETGNIESLLNSTTTCYYRAFMNDGYSECYGEVKSLGPYAVLNGETLTFYYDSKKNEREGTVYEVEEITSWAYRPAWSDKFTTAVFDASFANYRPTSTAYWFYECSSLKKIENIAHLNTSNVTDMSYMFRLCSSLTSLDLSSFDTSNVTDMGEMFSGCRSLTSLDVSYFDTSNVTNMYEMFDGCSSLTSLDLSSFDTSNVTNLGGMFYCCSSLTSLNLSNFDTSKVTDMWQMFAGCSSLTSLDFRNLNISRCSISYCEFPDNIAVLDLRNIIMPNMRLRYLFYNPSSLKKLNLSNANTSNMISMAYMFQDFSSLTSLDLSHFDTSNVTNMAGMFMNNVSSFDTSNVTDMAVMFRDCSSLTSLDVSSFNTSNVTNMAGMFECCSSLTSLDLSSFNTSNVTNMGDMFSFCDSLTYIDFRNLNFAKCGDDVEKCPRFPSNIAVLDVRNIIVSNDCRGLFRNKKRLRTLNLSNANSSNATTMKWMFDGCSSLTSLDLSSFDTSNVTDMYEMFKGCSSLTSLDLSSFNTSNVTNMYHMFGSCRSLESLDLSSFNTSNVTNMQSMFSDCSSLTSLDVNSFNTSNVTNMGYMFSDCSSLTSLDVSSFNTSNVTNMYEMFKGCSSLQTIYGGNWDKNSPTWSDMFDMFYRCEALRGGKGTHLGNNLYGYDANGNPLYYYCSDDGSAAHIDGGKDNPGLFTAK